MRYLGHALIAVIVLGACTEPEPSRQLVAPTTATTCREATLIAVDTTINYRPFPSEFPARLTRSLPTFSKGTLVGIGARYLAASFVIDTTGYVISSSVQMESPPWPAGDQAFCDWLRHAQFEPVRRDGRPIRAAVHNLWGIVTGTPPKPE